MGYPSGGAAGPMGYPSWGRFLDHFFIEFWIALDLHVIGILIPNYLPSPVRPHRAPGEGTPPKRAHKKRRCKASAVAGSPLAALWICVFLLLASLTLLSDDVR